MKISKKILILIFIICSIYLYICISSPKIITEIELSSYISTQLALQHLAAFKPVNVTDAISFISENEIWEISSSSSVVYTLKVSGKDRDWSVLASPNYDSVFRFNIFNRILLCDFSKQKLPYLHLDSETLEVNIINR